MDALGFQCCLQQEKCLRTPSEQDKGFLPKVTKLASGIFVALSAGPGQLCSDL